MGAASRSRPRVHVTTIEVRRATVGIKARFGLRVQRGRQFRRAVEHTCRCFWSAGYFMAQIAKCEKLTTRTFRSQRVAKIRELMNMMTCADDLLSLLNEQGIAFDVRYHKPVLRIDEFISLDLDLSGRLCKNLLVRNREGQAFLLVVQADKAVELRSVAQLLGSTRLSFVELDDMYEALGVRPGSLSPLALVNDSSKRIQLVVDLALAEEERLLFHPIENTATLSMSVSSLGDFCKYLGRSIHWLAVPTRAGFETR
jgi:Ala-tRNA(Pro) deacylase